MSNKKAIKEFYRLGGLISKYAHRWGENPSARLENWVFDYEDLREEYPEAFGEYCKQRGFSLEHDAYDCMA